MLFNKQVNNVAMTSILMLPYNLEFQNILNNCFATRFHFPLENMVLSPVEVFEQQNQLYTAKTLATLGYDHLRKACDGIV